MRVLIACEYSGTVRDAFIRAGHDAMSCDLLPTDVPGPHYQGDVLDVIGDGWDLMIAHPPCTFLTCAAEWAYNDVQTKKIKPGTLIDFVRVLLNAPIARIALENPVGVLSSRVRKPDQTVQPYQFGHDASKATCLWLKGLEPLTHTVYVEPRLVDGKKRWANQTDSGQNRLPPSEDRWKIRSTTFQGIADAMADQWGKSPARTQQSIRQLSLFPHLMP